MNKLFYALAAPLFLLGSFAKANDTITKTLQSDNILQVTVMTRSYCNNPRATLTLLAQSQKAVVYKLELTPMNRMLCAPGSKEISIELPTPVDASRSEQLILVTGANSAITEQE